MPIVVQPVETPEPPAIAPAEVADAQAAERVAVDRPPEEDVAGVARFIGLPFVGNEVGVGEQIVEDVRVQDGLVGQSLTELITFDILAVLLAVVEVELDLRRVESELSALLVLFDFPVVWHEGVSVAIDDRAIGEAAPQQLSDLPLELRSRLAKALQIIPSNAEAVEDFECSRHFRVRRVGNQAPHVGSPFLYVLAGSPTISVRRSREWHTNKLLSAAANTR